MPTCWWLWPLTQDELERVHHDLNDGALLVQRPSWGGDLRDVHSQICWEENVAGGRGLSLLEECYGEGMGLEFILAHHRIIVLQDKFMITVPKPLAHIR